MPEEVGVNSENVRLEPGDGGGHLLTVWGVPTILTDEELRSTFLMMLEYPFLQKSFDKALRRALRKIESGTQSSGWGSLIHGIRATGKGE